jgi:HEPN domain-containing protein
MSDETDLQEWLKYAEEDFASAQILFDGGRYATCAYHCQQALEKVLKAWIVSRTGTTPPHTHNFRDLLARIPDVSIPDEIQQTLAYVNPHYLATRYPGLADSGEYTRTNVRRLLERTKAAYEWFLIQLK